MCHIRSYLSLSIVQLLCSNVFYWAARTSSLVMDSNLCIIIHFQLCSHPFTCEYTVVLSEASARSSSGRPSSTLRTGCASNCRSVYRLGTLANK